MLPDMGFHTQLVIKTAIPFFVVAMLHTYPLICHLLGKKKRYRKASQFAARFSILVVELLLTSTTTMICRTFACDRFDDGWFLRAELTISCESSARRFFWIIYACVMLALFPFGE